MPTRQLLTSHIFFKQNSKNTLSSKTIKIQKCEIKAENEMQSYVNNTMREQ